MKTPNMKLSVLIFCAFLLHRNLAEDVDGYPKLSSETVTQTVTKTVVTKVGATQPPLMMAGGPVPPHFQIPTANLSVDWVEWSGSLPQKAVKVNISGTGQEEYICAPRTACNMTTGLYNPSKGPFCFHTCDGKEEQSSEFGILVSELMSLLVKDDDGQTVPKPRGSLGTGKPSLRGRARLSSNRLVRIDPQANLFLKWVEWSGSLPEWAVKVHIPGTGREDYICAPNHYGSIWNSGFYNPSLGSFCFNGLWGIPGKDAEFDILVNEHNLELLEWKNFEGNVKNGVTAYTESRKYAWTYVGKIPSGIGSISSLGEKEMYAFSQHAGTFLQDRGFDILTVETSQTKSKIHNVKYLTDDLAMLSQRPTVFNQMKVENHNCREIEQEVNLQGSTERQSSWESSISNSVTLSASIEVSVPFVTASAGVEYSNSKTVTNGNSLTETVSHSLTVKVNVPPIHSCVVKMAGKSKEFNIPYTAVLTREYPNGRVHSVPLSGTYKGVQVGEMHAVAERCVPMHNAEPCPS